MKLDEDDIQNPQKNLLPTTSRNRLSSEECFDQSNSNNCSSSSSSSSNNNNNNNNNKSEESGGLNFLTNIDNESELRYHHSNFTFDFPLCLIHVGKTAGSSISCGLGLMYADCEGMPRQPPVPHTGFFHMRKNNCLRNYDRGKDIATLMITTRNPLTRIQSWFNFEKNILPTRRDKQAEEMLRLKRKLLFIDCYDNFQELVMEGLDVPLNTTIDNNDTYKVSTEKPIDMTCKERAWAAVLGVREFSYHEWFNYEYYWTALKDLYIKNDLKSSDSVPSLLVLRTEHLSEDWSQLSKEELFRQVNKGNPSDSGVVPPLLPNISTPSSFILNNTQAIDEVASVDNLSSRFWLNLCRAMCAEIRIYQQILEQASNLNASQVQESISEVQSMCPWYDSKERSCPRVPRFPLIKVPRRQYRAETKKRLFMIG